jgi:hypothetical protein
MKSSPAKRYLFSIVTMLTAGFRASSDKADPDGCEATEDLKAAQDEARSLFIAISLDR